MSVNLFTPPAAPATNVDRAEVAWGVPLPRWVKLLAEECDRTSQGAAGKRLGRSGGYVNRLLHRTYPGDMAEAERIVLSQLGEETVGCPAIGDTIALKTCMANRRRKGSPQNFLHHLYARHCPNCPANTDRDDD